MKDEKQILKLLEEIIKTKLNATLYFGKNPRILRVGGADIPFKVIETKT